MPRLKIFLSLIFLATIVTSCEKVEEKSFYLQNDSDIPYKVKISNRHFGSDMEEGFRLSVEPKKGDVSFSERLRSDQCLDVKIIQEPKEIFIFYKSLELNYFSNDLSNESINLCHLGNLYCQDLLQQKIKQGVGYADICKFK
jgi:hypothetical protein